MNSHRFTLLALAFAGACTAKDAETSTVSASSTGDASSSSSGGASSVTEGGTSTGTSGDSTGPVAPTTGSSGDVDPSTSTVGDSIGTTEEPPVSTTETSDSRGDECASTCGVSIECEHPAVDDSLGARACEEGFHCVNASDCGCGVTFCAADCDPNDPRACLAGEVCDGRTGECVPA